jgi:hypothetical protein
MDDTFIVLALAGVYVALHLFPWRPADEPRR